MYLKRNDLVVIISGVNKKKQGRVLRVIKEQGLVVVQGLNMRYKHLRRSQKNPQGGRVQREAPLQISNVQIVDPKTNQPTRVGFRIEDGKKVRYAKKSGERI